MESGIEKEVSTRQEQIAKNAKNLPLVSFTSLAYHIDVKWLYVAYKMTRKDGAVGVDGTTAKEYAKELRKNLEELLEKAKSGLYRAPAVRRVYIPKDKKEKRPIGIPTFEDKVLQRAGAMVIEPVYEQDFLSCSYGFRPGKSQHMALEKLWTEIMGMGGAWVIDLDISKYFDTIDHGKLIEILKKRVRDGVILRLIRKWLNAGVMEKGQKTYAGKGTPQGGVISPLLSNIYLHEVLDIWFEKEVKPRMKSKASMVRFADDAVLIFQSREDVERVMEVLPKRFEKYGLKIHPEKTKMIEFKKPNNKNDDSGTFNFLGFKHYWAKSRKGYWVVKRKTEKSRLTRSLKKIKDWIREHRHEQIKYQQDGLNLKLRGHYGYYGITCNIRSLQSFFQKVKAIWFKWLNRRSRNRQMGWNEFQDKLEYYQLLRPRIVHSYI